MAKKKGSAPDVECRSPVKVLPWRLDSSCLCFSSHCLSWCLDIRRRWKDSLSLTNRLDDSDWFSSWYLHVAGKQSAIEKLQPQPAPSVLLATSFRLPSSTSRLGRKWKGQWFTTLSLSASCTRSSPFPGWIALVGGGRHNVRYNDGGCWLRLGISGERQVPCSTSQLFCLCKSGTPFRCAPVAWILWPTNFYVYWKDKVCVCVLSYNWK